MSMVPKIRIPTVPQYGDRKSAEEQLRDLTQHTANLTLAMGQLAEEVAETKGHVIGIDSKLETFTKTVRRKLQIVQGEVEETREGLETMEEDSKVHLIKDLQDKLKERNKELKEIKDDETWTTRRIKGRVIDILVTALLSGSGGAIVYWLTHK